MIPPTMRATETVDGRDRIEPIFNGDGDEETTVSLVGGIKVKYY